MNKLKKILLSIWANISKVFFYFIYDRKYLQSKYFTEEEKFIGYKWCWQNLIGQKIRRINGSTPWTVSPYIKISNYNNLIFHPEDINNFQGFGKYFQNFDAKIIIGKGTYIADNVGIITSNHSLKNLDKHLPGKDVVIGEQCWIGMNSVILPGVELGKKTIVGAGSIVTKSFIEGNCVIAGNPAKLIKKI